MFTNFLLLLCYSGSPAWQFTLFTDTFCCVTELWWLTSLAVGILHWHPLLCCTELKRLTNMTVYIIHWHPCCVVQSLRDWPVWQFTLFTDTLSCYRAKETHQIDSLHCSLTPSVVTELRRLTRSTVYIVHWHPQLLVVTELRRLTRLTVYIVHGHLHLLQS